MAHSAPCRLARPAALAGLLAIGIGMPVAAPAQVGDGLLLVPRTYAPPGKPLIAMETDEDAQAQAVLRGRLWLAFVETVRQQIQPPPDAELLASSCRASIRARD